MLQGVLFLITDFSNGGGSVESLLKYILAIKVNYAWAKC